MAARPQNDSEAVEVSFTAGERARAGDRDRRSLWVAAAAAKEGKLKEQMVKKVKDVEQRRSEVRATPCMYGCVCMRSSCVKLCTMLYNVVYSHNRVIVYTYPHNMYTQSCKSNYVYMYGYMYIRLFLHGIALCT
jgi:hypothetical protein